MTHAKPFIPRVDVVVAKWEANQRKKAEAAQAKAARLKATADRSDMMRLHKQVAFSVADMLYLVARADARRCTVEDILRDIVTKARLAHVGKSS